MATIVTIGRNVNGVPMTTDAWRAFNEETFELVERYAGPVVFDGEGVGIWGDEREVAATLIGERDYIQTASLFVRDLRDLAVKYGQEAIALTIANTTLVGRTR